MASENISTALRQLSKALAGTKDSSLVYDFLHAILTPNEISEVATRWALVLQIYEGKSQRKIADELGLSLCKITRGSRELKKENSTFKKMIEKWKEVESR